jgi:hypothetical protein
VPKKIVVIAPISVAVVPLPSLMAGVPGGSKGYQSISDWSTPFGTPLLHWIDTNGKAEHASSMSSASGNASLRVAADVH